MNNNWKQYIGKKPSQIRNNKYPYFDVNDFIKKNGIQKEYIEYSGSLRYKNGIPIIGVNAKETKERQNYAIAHELGHLFIHTEESFKDTDFTSGDKNKQSEANMFARQILMPEQHLFHLKSIVTKNEDIAKIFGVSETALNI